jgi:hypothetical protein
MSAILSADEGNLSVFEPSCGKGGMTLSSGKKYQQVVLSDLCDYLEDDVLTTLRRATECGSVIYVRQNTKQAQPNNCNVCMLNTKFSETLDSTLRVMKVCRNLEYIYVLCDTNLETTGNFSSQLAALRSSNPGDVAAFIAKYMAGWSVLTHPVATSSFNPPSTTPVLLHELKHNPANGITARPLPGMLPDNVEGLMELYKAGTQVADLDGASLLWLMDTAKHYKPWYQKCKYVCYKSHAGHPDPTVVQFMSDFIGQMEAENLSKADRCPAPAPTKAGLNLYMTTAAISFFQTIFSSLPIHSGAHGSLAHHSPLIMKSLEGLVDYTRKKSTEFSGLFWLE